MRRRMLVPAGVAGAIALATGLTHVSSASADTPTLPQITAQQLLVKASHPQVAGLSGSVEWVANLGLPDLSLLGAGGQGGDSAAFNPTSLLSGTHTFTVWDAGADRQRVALPWSLAEVDLVRDGDQAWTFDSATQKVTHYVAAAGSGQAPADQPDPSTEPALTPDQAAAQLLAHLDPTTNVSVVTPVYVAGQAAYELLLSPKAADSTVGSVTVAVDAANGLPLQVQVFAKGASAPALSLGYTKVDFTVPGAGTFAAPTGATIVTKTLGGHGTTSGADHHGDANAPTVTGTGWGTVVTFAGGTLSPAETRQLDAVSTPVTLADGTSGRLVRTALLNAVVTGDGRIVAGFVDPAALEAAAAAPAG